MLPAAAQPPVRTLPPPRPGIKNSSDADKKKREALFLRYLERFECGALRQFWVTCDGKNWKNSNFFDPDYVEQKKVEPGQEEVEQNVGASSPQKPLPTPSALPSVLESVSEMGPAVGLGPFPSISTLGDDSIGSSSSGPAFAPARRASILGAKPGSPIAPLKPGSPTQQPQPSLLPPVSEPPPSSPAAALSSSPPGRRLSVMTPSGGLRRKSSVGLAHTKPGGPVSEDAPPPERWFGVKAFRSRVIKIDLHENNLTGFLPGGPGTGVFPLTVDIPPDGTHLTLLSNMKVLILFKNQLMGPIPSTYEKFTKLQHLDLSHNNLEGPIPHGLFSITPLKRLHLENNRLLTGTIPESLTTLVNLESFTAQFNKIEGELPQNISACTSLTELNLHHNRLIGEIPASLKEMKQLTKLHLSNNHFTLPEDPAAVSDLIKSLATGCSIPQSPRGRSNGCKFLQILPQPPVGEDDDDWDEEGGNEESTVLTLDTPGFK